MLTPALASTYRAMEQSVVGACTWSCRAWSYRTPYIANSAYAWLGVGRAFETCLRFGERQQPRRLHRDAALDARAIATVLETSQRPDDPRQRRGVDVAQSRLHARVPQPVAFSMSSISRESSSSVAC